MSGRHCLCADAAIAANDSSSAGRPATEDTFAAVAASASKQCRPLINVPYDDDWRHAMVPVLVTRALRDAFGIASA